MWNQLAKPSGAGGGASLWNDFAKPLASSFGQYVGDMASGRGHGPMINRAYNALNPQPSRYQPSYVHRLPPTGPLPSLAYLNKMPPMTSQPW
jgi:hypothetical protein